MSALAPPQQQQQQTAKKIIKLTQTQLQELLNATRIHSTPQTLAHSIVSLTPPSKIGGLFDQDIEIDIDKGPVSCCSSDDFLNDSNEVTLTPSKFAQKLKNLNMKIKLPNPIDSFEFTSSSSDLKLTEDEWDTLVNISNEFDECLLPPDLNLNSLVCETAALEKCLADTDLFSQSLLEATCLDHGYSKSPLKRSSDFLDELDSSFVKKHRPRGVYRLDDVTNDEEMKNYKERRIKNNISSKASRANKKSLYNDMDARNDFLEDNNKLLQERIVKKEKARKVLQEYLMERFVGK
jgi:hypothetical protein